jgi:hypothetical protein
MESIHKWRRNRLRDKIIANGQELRKVQTARAGVDARHWPHDVEYLDAVINKLERRHKALLTKFKEA